MNQNDSFVFLWVINFLFRRFSPGVRIYLVEGGKLPGFFGLMDKDFFASSELTGSLVFHSVGCDDVFSIHLSAERLPGFTNDCFAIISRCVLIECNDRKGCPMYDPRPIVGGRDRKRLIYALTPKMSIGGRSKTEGIRIRSPTWFAEVIGQNLPRPPSASPYWYSRKSLAPPIFANSQTLFCPAADYFRSLLSTLFAS